MITPSFIPPCLAPVLANRCSFPDAALSDNLRFFSPEEHHLLRLFLEKLPSDTAAAKWLAFPAHQRLVQVLVFSERDSLSSETKEQLIALFRQIHASADLRVPPLCLLSDNKLASVLPSLYPSKKEQFLLFNTTRGLSFAPETEMLSLAGLLPKGVTLFRTKTGSLGFSLKALTSPIQKSLTGLNKRGSFRIEALYLDALPSDQLSRLPALLQALSSLVELTVCFSQPAAVITIEALQNNCIPRLQRLTLSHNQLNDQSATALIQALQNTNRQSLTHLSLSSNSITNEGIFELVRASQTNSFLQMQHLSLSANFFGSTGALALAQAINQGYLPKLQRLHYNGSLPLNQEGKTALANATEALLLQNQ